MRLIDADELRLRMIEKLHMVNPLGDITNLIDNAPTIEPSKSTDQKSVDVPSGDLISRAEAIAYIDRVTNSGLGKYKSLEYIRKYISALPSADRPKGEWIDREDSTDMFFLYKYECSVCDGKNVFNSSYCPNCGAHMR